MYVFLNYFHIHLSLQRSTFVLQAYLLLFVTSVTAVFLGRNQSAVVISSFRVYYSPLDIGPFLFSCFHMCWNGIWIGRW
jgi:hypothetical protein